MKTTFISDFRVTLLIISFFLFLLGIFSPDPALAVVKVINLFIIIIKVVVGLIGILLITIWNIFAKLLPILDPLNRDEFVNGLFSIIADMRRVAGIPESNPLVDLSWIINGTVDNALSFAEQVIRALLDLFNQLIQSALDAVDGGDSGGGDPHVVVTED